MKTEDLTNAYGAKYARLTPSDMRILSQAEEKLTGRTGQTVALVAYDAGK